jgi:hypothetical protein
MGDFDAFDTTVNLTAAQCAGLRAAGVRTVLRYLAHSSGIGKIIRPAEAQIIRASGLRLVLNWEQAASTLLTSVTADLRLWAAETVLAAQNCGAPPGDVIPVSVDFNVSPAQWDAVVAPNLAAFDRVLQNSGLRATVYGSGYACRRALEAGYPPPWQSMSTGWRESATTVPGVALRQLRGQTVAGVAGDVNKIVRPDSWAGSGGSGMGTTDQVIAAWSHGIDHTPDGAAVEPVKWRLRDEAWQQKVDTTLTGIQTAVAGLTPAPAGGGGDPVSALQGVASALQQVATELAAVAAALAPPAGA